MYFLSEKDQRGRSGWLTIKGDTVLYDASDGSIDIHFTARQLEAVNYNEGTHPRASSIQCMAIGVSLGLSIVHLGRSVHYTIWPCLNLKD